MASINVIIPVWNAEKYIENTIYSILNQPEKDIEIIIIDDGSTDKSGEICDNISNIEKRVHVIHKVNGGVSSARNDGINFALEKNHLGYIAFCDADDLWVPNTFDNTTIRIIKKEDADIIGFSMYCSNATANRFYVSNKYDNNIIIKEKYEINYKYWKGSFAAHLYNIKLFKENHVRFDEKCAHNEDVIFLAKMIFCSEKLLYMDKFMYIYRKNRLSSTGTFQCTIDNAIEIPDAWDKAKIFADSCIACDKNAKINWQYFCETTSSIRCLEMLSILVEQDVAYSVIYNVMKNKNYYVGIDNLKEDELAVWQKKDLILFKNNKKKFYKKKKNKIKKVFCKLVHLNFVNCLFDLYKYNLSLKNLEKKECKINVRS